MVIRVPYSLAFALGLGLREIYYLPFGGVGGFISIGSFDFL